MNEFQQMRLKALSRLRMQRSTASANEARQRISNANRSNRTGVVTGYRNGRPIISLAGSATGITTARQSSGSLASGQVLTASVSGGIVRAGWRPRGS